MTTYPKAAVLRSWLLESVWGGELPAALPAVVEGYTGESAFTSWGSPIISRLDLLTVPTLRGGNSYVHLCHPAADPELSHVVRNRAVFVFAGHSDHYYAEQAWLTYRLLREGYHVIGVCMPVDGFNIVQHFEKLNGDPVTVVAHNFAELEADGASPLRFFLDGAIGALNHLQAFYDFADFSACGFSGGGFSVDLWAAADKRITRTYPICGSVPFPQRSPSGPGQAGDWEQLQPRSWWSVLTDYDRAWYLACAERGRRRIQFLGNTDPVFPAANIATALEAYDDAIQSQIKGAHEIRIFDANNEHKVTQPVIDAILGDLDRF